MLEDVGIPRPTSSHPEEKATAANEMAWIRVARIKSVLSLREA
jgi:hypothetical protein